MEPRNKYIAAEIEIGYRRLEKTSARGPRNRMGVREEGGTVYGELKSDSLFIRDIFRRTNEWTEGRTDGEKRECARCVFVLISSRQEMRLSIGEPARFPCSSPSKETESPEMRISIRLTRNNGRAGIPRRRCLEVNVVRKRDSPPANKKPVDLTLYLSRTRLTVKRRQDS